MHKLGYILPLKWPFPPVKLQPVCLTVSYQLLVNLCTSLHLVQQRFLWVHANA